MEPQSIGSLEVSAIGLGTNMFGRKLGAEGAERVVGAAIDAGITFFDTADRYGGGGVSEQYLGQALRGRRDEVVIATKFGLEMDGDPTHAGGGKDWVPQACEDSLRRLGTDHLDLFYLHFPDPDTPLEETLLALGELVTAGKVREVGCSNYSSHLLREAVGAAQHDGAASYVAVQNEYSLVHREADETGVLDACRELRLAFVPYFPLASGLLTGKYGRDGSAPPDSRLAQMRPHRPHLDLSERNLALVEELRRFATDHGHTILDLAFAWLLAHDEIPTVIAGATSPEQVVANAAAASWRLSDADIDDVQVILAAHDLESG